MAKKLPHTAKAETYLQGHHHCNANVDRPDLLPPGYVEEYEQPKRVIGNVAYDRPKLFRLTDAGKAAMEAAHTRIEFA